MKSITFKMSKYHEKRDYLIKKKIPHELILTNNTSIINVPKLKKRLVFSNKILRKTDLIFISNVKNDARLSGLEFPTVLPEDITYFKYYIDGDVNLSRVVEVDVNGAYWEIAKREGIIGDEIYRRGLEVPKMTRLIGLGSLATVKNVIGFDGVEYGDVEKNIRCS